MNLLARFQCWRQGHKRGRFLRLDRTAIGETIKVYGCARCGRERSYKVKQEAMPKNGGQPGDER